MPTYDYECSSCGYRFEAFQGINEKHLAKCPKCNKKIRRLIGSGAGIIFKGPGFYATDYRKNPRKEKADLAQKKAACPQAKEKGCDTCQFKK